MTGIDKYLDPSIPSWEELRLRAHNKKEPEHMSTWKPSEGLKRADAVVSSIEAAAYILGYPIGADPVLHHRITEIIAKALDQAITDETTACGMAVVGNGKHPNPVYDDYSVTAEAIGAAPNSEYAQLNDLVDFPMGVEASEPKKKRGRPKGAKGKKKARAAKPVEEAAEAPGV